MIKQNIKFLTTGQFLTFSHTCKNLSSDVRIQDLENHNRVDINGKDLSELATIQLGLPFLLVIFIYFFRKYLSPVFSDHVFYL